MAPYSVKLLVDEATMHAAHASLSLLTVSPANRIAMHKHPGAEVLYLIKGHMRVVPDGCGASLDCGGCPACKAQPRCFAPRRRGASLRRVRPSHAA